MKLNPDVKEAWLEALRSGEYQQGRGILRDAGGYCCLGVLCDLAERRRLVRFDPDNLRYESVALPTDAASGQLPLTVASWAGLGDNGWGVVETDPKVFVEGAHQALSTVNDELGYDFDQIADLIREQL